MKRERREDGGIRLVRFLLAGLIILSASLVEANEGGISNRVKVAILDSGCNIAYKEGISLIDRTVKDYNGHGTLMARIIKEKAPQAELYIIKVMDKEGLCVNEEAVIRGIEWAVSRGVDLINMSLRLRDSEKLHKAINKAYEKGIIIIAAAGNANSRVALLNKGGGINLTEVAYPAKYGEVIAVGAVDRYGKVYDGSINPVRKDILNRTGLSNGVKGKEVEVVCRGYKGRSAGTSIASAYATGIVARIIFENSHLYATPKGTSQRAEELRCLIHQHAENSL